MSAFLGLCRADRVELMTDGASIDPRTNILKATCDKAFILPGCSAAMSMRGNAEVIRRFQETAAKAFEVAGSFDIAVAAIGEALPAYDELPDILQFELLIGGISETKGPQLAYLITRAYKPGIKSCHMYLTGPGSMNCNGIMRDDEKTRQFERIGLDTCGMFFMEGIRREKSNGCFEDGPSRYGIGGHVDMTTITAAGATTCRVHTWPDKIGEPINPFAGTNVTPLHPPMNRQQRRAAEREQRKRA